MRGKRELPRKRPPILLFVLIFAAGFLAGTLFWHFHPSGTSVPSGGTVTLPDGPVGTDVSSEPEIPPAPPQMEELSAEPTPFVISFLGDCTLTSSHHTNHFEKLVEDDYAYPFSNVAELLLADDLTLANLECSFSSPPSGVRLGIRLLRRSQLCAGSGAGRCGGCHPVQ